MTSSLNLVRKTESRVTLDEILKPVAAELQAVRKFYREFLLARNNESDVNYLQEITELFNSHNKVLPAPVVVDVARHILQREGKWVRAAIVELVAKMFGRAGEDTSATAASVELIHVATLIHDDIVDNAEYRRGQKSVPANWGISISVLVGDFLYAKAFALLAELDCPEAIRSIARSTRDVALGEIQEMRFFGEGPVTQDEYYRMIHNKTASLFGACAESGAYLAWMDKDTATTCRRAAVALGMAFQIADDVLDLSSCTEDLGKDADADWKNGKLTLPLLLLKERAPGFLQDGVLPDTLELHNALREHGCLEEAANIARREATRAKEDFLSVAALVRKPDCLNSLLSLCDFVVERKK